MPPAHWLSAVHQQVTPPAEHVPVGPPTSLQLPVVQAMWAVEVRAWQPETSPLPLPVQLPVHCPLPLTHLPLEQSESATHRQAVCAALHAGVGESVVAQT